MMDWIEKLSLEEKIGLLEGADMGFTFRIERLGIPRILLADGPHGVRVVKGTDQNGKEPYTMNGEMNASTTFPCEAAMAASWNDELVTKAGCMIGEECRVFGAGVLLGPGVNGKRSPLAGRNFEYYSEDPYLSGKMAIAFINGVQSQKVGTCLKHFAVNDQETRRTSIDVQLDERTLREIYLKPFEMAVKNAKPWCIMGSYNKIRGKYACENEFLLKDILRKEWKFEGTVISDWSAVQNKIESHKNGLDLQMPGPSGKLSEMKIAVEKGNLPETALNEAVAHVLKLVEKASQPDQGSMIDWEEHHRCAVELAEEGMVLLKNEKDILPLSSGTKLAVVGMPAKEPIFTGGGSASLIPRKLDIPLESLKENAEIEFAPGFLDDEINEKLLVEAEQAAKGKDAVLLFAGIGSTEGLDRTTLRLPKVQEVLLRRLLKVNNNIILIMQSGSAVEYLPIENDVKAILHCWYAGEGIGCALSNIIFGKSCPSGRLSESFPRTLANTPAYANFPGYKDDVAYHEGLMVGYRYYDTAEIAPFYSFGYGLSYTTFAYDNMQVSSKELHNGEELVVAVDVTNTGRYKGKEVVQIYVHDDNSSMFRPVRELKGYAKVELNPGETKKVEIVLDEDAFSYYVPHLNRFAVEAGTFTIYAGASSRDLRCCSQIIYCSLDDVRSPLNRNDQLKDYLSDERYAANTERILTLLHVNEKHPLYELMLGCSLNQFSGLFPFLNLSVQEGEKMITCIMENSSYKAN